MDDSYSRRSRQGTGCGFGCSLLIVLFLALVGLTVYWSLDFAKEMARSGRKTGGLTLSSSGHGVDEYPEMEEIWSSGTGSVKVVRIPIRGMIMMGEGSSLSPGSAGTALRAIRLATKDPAVKGIIMDVDSGGGGVTASDILYHALKKFKASGGGRQVVTIMGDVAASGAYYLAVASDYIMAHPTTITGSIGVIMHSFNVKGLVDKIGISDVTIKSGKNKDLLNPMQPVNPEQQAILQKMVDTMYERFVGLVAMNRRLKREAVVPYADGRVLTAQEALKAKLIDGIGYFEDAQAKVAELLKEEDVKVVRYEEEKTIWSLFSRPFFGFRGDIGKLLQERESRMMYRWNPVSE